MSNDLPKLALEVSAVWSPPERRAISIADVRIAKLVRAAAEHECRNADLLAALETIARGDFDGCDPMTLRMFAEETLAKVGR